MEDPKIDIAIRYAHNFLILQIYPHLSFLPMTLIIYTTNALQLILMQWSYQRADFNLLWISLEYMRINASLSLMANTSY